MATVTATLKMFDAMTKPLQNITNSMNLMIRTMEDMQKATDRNVKLDRTLAIAKKQLALAEAEIKQSIEQANQAQQQFNRSVKNTQTSTEGLVSSIKRMAAGLAAAYLSARGIKTAIEAADTFISTRARLELIVDEGQSVEQLQNMIYAASQRARGDFGAMADNVSRLGLLARDAFESTAELVSFTETMQKAFKISGASIQEQSAAMYQLSQAMAAGRLQGDEFVSIMENAPMLAGAIADFVGVSRGELKKLSSEGKITSDVIKGALFAASEEINQRFASMPKTFGDVFQGLRNEAIKGFEPVFRRMNEWLNSAEGAAMVQTLTNSLHIAAVAADWLFQILQTGWTYAYQGFEFVSQLVQNLGVIIAGLSPLILGAASAWLFYLAVTRSVTLWMKIQEGVTKAVTIAQRALNFVMKMNPIMRVITLVIGLITAFATMIQMSKGVKQALADAFEFVVNTAEKAVNAVISVINSAIRGINKVAGFFANLLGVEVKAIKEIEFRADFERIRETGRDFIEDFSLDKIREKFGLDRLDGFGGDDSLKDMLKQTEDMSKYLKGIDAGIGDVAKGVGKVGKIGKVDSVKRIEEAVDISQEDIRLMRELAERRAIQQVTTTLTPTVHFHGGVHVREEADIDRIIAKIESALEREIANSAGGIYT